MRRVLTVMAFGLGALLAPVASAASTYSSSTAHLQIPDAGSVTSTIVVAPGVEPLSSVRIADLSLQHQYPADLSARLKSPQGTEIELFNQICTGEWTTVSGVVDIADSAPISIRELCPLNGQSGRPINPLSAFVNESPVGTWTLTLGDSRIGDQGLLTGWKLVIDKAPEPALALDLHTLDANAEVGSQIVVRADVKNVGLALASNSRLQFVVPGSVVSRSTETLGFTCIVLACNVPPLAPGAQASVWLTVTPTIPGHLSVSASLSSSAASEILTASDSATTGVAGLACTSTGTSRSEKLRGTSGADVICALAGSDTISGLGVGDRVYAGEGNDTILDGPSNQRYDGGRGTDTLDFRASPWPIHAAISGGTSYGNGEDSFINVEGITGSRYGDVIVGSRGIDYLWGQTGNDRLFGNLGSDSLFGGDGKNLLSGGDGNDSLHTKGRRDMAAGGLGRDLCVRKSRHATLRSCERVR